MRRVETKHLFRESVSQKIKSLILKSRAGITLNESDKKKLDRFNESVSMVEVPKNRKGIVYQKPQQEPYEDDIENELDLDEILKEMGYDEEEDTEDITKLSKSSLKDLIKQEIKNYLDNEPDDLDLNEIIEELTK